MSKRKTQTRTAKFKSDDRRAAAYEIVKAMAERENVPLPNRGNKGAEFDEWLRKKLPAVKVAKEQQ